MASAPAEVGIPFQALKSPWIHTLAFVTLISTRFCRPLVISVEVRVRLSGQLPILPVVTTEAMSSCSTTSLTQEKQDPGEYEGQVQRIPFERRKLNSPAVMGLVGGFEELQLRSAALCGIHWFPFLCLTSLQLRCCVTLCSGPLLSLSLSVFVSPKGIFLKFPSYKAIVSPQVVRDKNSLVAIHESVE